MVPGDQFYIKFGGDSPANYNGVVINFDNLPYTV